MIDPGTASEAGSWPEILKYGRDFAISFFLLANYTVLLNPKHGYKRNLMIYGGLAVLVAAAFYMVVERYAVGLVDMFYHDPAASRETVVQTLRAFTKDGFLILIIRHGKTHGEYEQFLHSNLNAWHFSLFTAVVLVISAFLDVLLLLILPLFVINCNLPKEALLKEYTQVTELLIGTGFGRAVTFLPAAPFVLLLNYKKTYKNRTQDIFIPIIAVSVMLVTAVEIGYQQILTLPETLALLFGL